MKLLSVIKRPLHWGDKDLPIGTQFRASGPQARVLIATGRAEEVKHPPPLSPTPKPRQTYRRRDMFAERPIAVVDDLEPKEPATKSDTE